MTGAAPYLASQVTPWLTQLSGTAHPEDYFKHPDAFPALLLPRWLERAVADTPDHALQSDLVYSTLNGYYYIRLIDNLMDGNATVELKLLPALGFFHTRFQIAYQPYFAANHNFWHLFTRVWFHSADVTSQDANLYDLDAVQFEQVAARKTCAAKIPLAAVAYRYDRPDLIEPWSHFVDRFGAWHQLFNDLFDWHRDAVQPACTYFLSEAERRREPEEPVAAWVAREGFAWAIDKLRAWLAGLKGLATPLQSPDLLTYLDLREKRLNERQKAVEGGLKDLARLLALDI
jgi:hypothetical protein